MEDDEIAKLKDQIIQSYQTAYRVLSSISARIEKIAECQEQLVDLVGADEATKTANKNTGKVTRYIPQRGDICRWPYQKVEYIQEYNGYCWSGPIDLNDGATTDPALYARVTRLIDEPERYEIIHRKKSHRKTYYRAKS